MEQWVQVVTYDWLMGIPSWAERDYCHIGDRDSYHEFTVPPDTILWLDPEVAAHLLHYQRWAAYLPGERQPYTPVLERRKEEKHEEKEEDTRPRRRRRDRGGEHESTRVIRLWG